MRKLVVLATCLMLVLGVSAFADEIAKPVSAKVLLNIDPNIALNVLTGIVDGGSLQLGDKEVQITFRVDANTEAVELYGLVTQLWKGNDPSGTEVRPIDPVGGLQIDPDNANEVLGGNGFAGLVGAMGDGSWDGPEGTFPGQFTRAVVFESSQNAHFSQDVIVSAKYNNSDAEKPRGEYSGYVVLYGAVVQ